MLSSETSAARSGLWQVVEVSNLRSSSASNRSEYPLRLALNRDRCAPCECLDVWKRFCFSKTCSDPCYGKSE